MDANDIRIKAAEYSGIATKKFQQDAMDALSHDMTVIAMSPLVRQLIATVAMDAYEAAYKQCMQDIATAIMANKGGPYMVLIGWIAQRQLTKRCKYSK